MDKMDKGVLVVPKDKLFWEQQCHGFRPIEGFDFRPVIMKNYVFKRRGDMEENPDFKQIIPYLIVVNKKHKTLYVYRRAEHEKEYTEKRLFGKYSIGTGGHIDPEDDGDNPLISNIRREFREEIILDPVEKPVVRCIGFINDDDDPVGKVHFGVVYLLETDSVIASRNESEANVGGMVTKAQLEEIKSREGTELESWSDICLEPVWEILEDQLVTN